MSDDDWYFEIAKAASHALFETGPPGGTLIDIFPFCAYVIGHSCLFPERTSSAKASFMVSRHILCELCT